VTAGASRTKGCIANEYRGRIGGLRRCGMSGPLRRWLFLEAANRATSVMTSRSSIGYDRPGSIYRISSRRREEQPDSV
jgi:hypothetical protein